MRANDTTFEQHLAVLYAKADAESNRQYDDFETILGGREPNDEEFEVMFSSKLTHKEKLDALRDERQGYYYFVGLPRRERCCPWKRLIVGDSARVLSWFYDSARARLNH